MEDSRMVSSAYNLEGIEKRCRGMQMDAEESRGWLQGQVQSQWQAQAQMQGQSQMQVQGQVQGQGQVWGRCRGIRKDRAIGETGLHRLRWIAENAGNVR